MDARDFVRTRTSNRNVHWDSSIAQRTRTHFSSLGLTSWSSFINFLAHLLNTTYSAVDQNPYPPTIIHRKGLVDLMPGHLAASDESGRQDCGFEIMRHTFTTHPLCGAPITTATQAFTMTLGETAHSDMFSGLVNVPNAPNVLSPMHQMC